MAVFYSVLNIVAQFCTKKLHINAVRARRIVSGNDDSLLKVALVICIFTFRTFHNNLQRATTQSDVIKFGFICLFVLLVLQMFNAFIVVWCELHTKKLLQACCKVNR